MRGFYKKLIAAVIFLFFTVLGVMLTPTTQIALVFGILLLTIYLFVFEIVEVDVAAITIMVLLGLTGLPIVQNVFGLESSLIDSKDLFNGFASNAVISIIAVMIIGAGLDKTGLMTGIARLIIKIGGRSEKRIIPITSATVSIISSFMQNVGAVALFIPVISRIAVRTNLPISRLLMPMGFTAILGGTITMVGSSPLILLNDLILSSNQGLAPSQQMQTWGLFSVTPIGLTLVAVGIIYFILAGHFVLPKIKAKSTSTSVMEYFQEAYDIHYDLFEVRVPSNSTLIGQKLDNIETVSKIRVVATRAESGDIAIGANAISRDTLITKNMVLGILTSTSNLNAFVLGFNLELSNTINVFSELLSSSQCGMAEVVIPPNSNLVGRSARDIWLRNTYGLAMVALHRGGKTLKEGEGIRDLKIQSGDTLIAYTKWSSLEHIRENESKNFVVVTTDYPHQEKTRPEKIIWASICFSIALVLILFTDIRLSIALLTGALGMILSGVLKIDEAYSAVSWKTVFLLASLIPLGLAVEISGTAKWIASETVALIGDMPIWVIQGAIALLTTVFTLIMSNVGATVLLVPLVVNIALEVGANPAIFALTVAIAASNSFLIPTHQVNALIMGPGGYRVADFMKAGMIMTLLFLLVIMLMLNLLF